MIQSKQSEPAAVAFDPHQDVMLIGMILGLPATVALAIVNIWLPSGWQYLGYAVIIVGVLLGARALALVDRRRFGVDK